MMMRFLTISMVAIVALSGCSREPEARGKSLGEWVTILNRSNDIAQLKECAAALTELGPQAEPAAWELVRVLSDRQWFAHYRSLNEQQVEEVYRAFAPALRAIGPAAGPTVVQAIENKRPVSGDVMRALDPAALPVVLKALEHNEVRVRRDIAKQWGTLGPNGRSGAEALTKAILNDPDAMVRTEATRSLGTIDADANIAIPVLQKALADKEILVRIAACNSLASFPKAADRWISDVAAMLGDAEPAVRAAAIQALSLCTNHRKLVASTLIPLLQGTHALSRDGAMQILVALDALGEVPVPILVIFLDSEGYATNAATVLLHTNPRALLFLPGLVGKLSGSIDAATARRQDVFAKIGAPAVPVLIKMLQYNEEPAAEAEVVRFEAAMALSMLREAAKPAIPTLEAMVANETSDPVRRAAIRALQQIR
jgi:HEAT repeat protein